MQMTVETLPNYRLACIRQVGPYGPANVQAMQQLKRWAESNHLLTPTSIILGISHDNPENTVPENCRYDAAIVISPDYQIDNSVCESVLPGGKYAVFQVKHTAEDIQKAWGIIFTELANGSHQIDERSMVERYIVEMVANHYCEICVPIK